MNNTPAKSLDLQLEHLALEASVSFNMAGGLKSIIPGLLDQISTVSSVINNFLASDKQTESKINLTADQKLAVQKLKAVSLLNYGDIGVMTPENFKGNLHQYVVALLTLSPKVYGSINELLGEYNGILSSFITNREDKTTLKTHEAFFRRIQRARIERENAIKHFFPKVTGKSRLPMKEVLSRVAEFETLLVDINKLSHTQQNQNLGQVSNMVQQSTDLLNIIHKSIKEDTKMVVGPEATMNISKGAFEVAKEVEHLATYHYQVSVAIAVVKAFCTTIIEN